MPGATKYPLSGNRLSRAELRKTMGKGPLYEFLNNMAVHDTVYFKDDFDRLFLDATNTWSVPTKGATATGWVETAGANGFIRGVTGTTAATSGLQLLNPILGLLGDNNAGCSFRWRTSDITELRAEFGLVNALPSVNTTVVNSLTTPTFNTTADAAIALYNHTGTTTTSGLYCIGTDSAAAKTATTTNRPVNDTWQKVRIQLLTNLAFLWIDGVMLTPNGVAMEGTDSLYLAVSFKNNSTTSQNIDIDLIEAWSDRS